MKKEKHPNRVICPRCGKPGTKRYQMIKCGRPNCTKCPHGPYWYVAHRIGNKTVSCYIGKTWPGEPEPWRKARKKPVVIEFREVNGEREEIKTREGMLYAVKDRDFVIRDGEGEIHPITKDIFFKTYDVF